MSKICSINWDTPTTQPTQQAYHQKKKYFLTKTGVVIVLRMCVQTDKSTPAAHRQRAAKIVKEQRKIFEAMSHRSMQIGLLNQGTANKGKTSRRHTVRIKFKKFIVEFANLDQPQSRKSTGRYASRRILYECRR